MFYYVIPASCYKAFSIATRAKRTNSANF